MMDAAGCRTRMTAGDLEFLVQALGEDPDDRAPLEELSRDPEALDRLLDDPRLFARLLEAPALLHVSPWFFYYVLVRRTFLDHGIERRRAADYVGALLSYHLQKRGDRPRQGGGVYLVDLVHAMREARTPWDAFALQTEIGDVALWLTGLFPDWVYYRRTYGRRPVDLEYYEAMGSRSWSAAASSETAGRLDLDEVLDYMAERFPLMRQALNDLVDEHLHLAPRPGSVSGLCRQALWRVTN